MKNGEISVPFLADGAIQKKTLQNEKQGGDFDPKVIAELKDMGYPEEKVLEALSVCDGDKSSAATYLMDQSSLA
jgi:hypothetical protein